MKVKFEEKEIELEYTFNSFKYMEDLDIQDLLNLANKPFKVVTVASQLLLGAANNSKSKFISMDEVDVFLEKTVIDGTFDALVETLIAKLIESDFFKLLQKKKK